MLAEVSHGVANRTKKIGLDVDVSQSAADRAQGSNRTRDLGFHSKFGPTMDLWGHFETT